MLMRGAFGGKEGLKNFKAQVFGNAGAAILDEYFDMVCMSGAD